MSHVDIRTQYVNDDGSTHSDDVIARVERTDEHLTQADFVAEIVRTLRTLADEFERHAKIS